MSDFPALPYPWQQNLWQRLERNLDSDRLPHALLLAGAAGTGKRHLGMALAQWLLCRAPVVGAACGRCHTCDLNRAGTHPDLLVLEPEEVGRKILVDNVRQLVDFLGKTAQQGGRKLVLLEPAEAMNANAANALLKGLEEPAAGTHLILISHNPGAVMATVRSRCQVQMLGVPPRDQVLPWLKPLVGNDGSRAESLLDLARGLPLKALSLLAGDTLERRQQWLDALGLLAQGRGSAIVLAGRWGKDDLGVALDWWVDWLHQLARWRVGGERPDQVAGELEASLSGFPASLLHRFAEKLLLSRQQLCSGANPNKQLLLEELLLGWQALARVRR